MLLYRYFASHALETLRDLQLKASKISEFNDPFEFMFRVEGEMTRKLAAEYVKSSIRSKTAFNRIKGLFPGVKNQGHFKQYVRDNRREIEDIVFTSYQQHTANTFENRTYVEELVDGFFRIVCFSSEQAASTDEILMWSHYANMHRGMRIGFEISALHQNMSLLQISYQKERVTLDGTWTYRRDQGTRKETVSSLIDSLRVKSEAWSYEKEYRLAVSPEDCQKIKIKPGLIVELLPFPANWIRRVDFGLKISEEDKKGMLEFLKLNYPTVEVRQACYNPSIYSLDYISC